MFLFEIHKYYVKDFKINRIPELETVPWIPDVKFLKENPKSRSKVILRGLVKIICNYVTYIFFSQLYIIYTEMKLIPEGFESGCSDRIRQKNLDPDPQTWVESI